MVAGHFLDMNRREDREHRFRVCWDQDGPRVAAFARRHVAADDVQEVVAETFLQAWRRWDDVMDPPLPWLLGTARKVIGNQRRSARRRIDLAHRIAMLDAAARPADDAGVLAAERVEALAAIASLSEREREALLLVAWDGLSPEQAGQVLHVRVSTLRVRLHRARARLSNSPGDTVRYRPQQQGSTS